MILRLYNMSFPLVGIVNSGGLSDFAAKICHK